MSPTLMKTRTYLTTVRFNVKDQLKISHEKNNTVVKVTPPSKNIVLLFGQPEKVAIAISLPN